MIIGGGMVLVVLELILGSLHLIGSK